MNYEEFDHAVNRAWGAFLDVFEEQTGVNVLKASEALNRKDVFNDTFGCLIQLVNIEED